MPVQLHRHLFLYNGKMEYIKYIFTWPRLWRAHLHILNSVTLRQHHRLSIRNHNRMLMLGNKTSFIANESPAV